MGRAASPLLGKQELTVANNYGMVSAEMGHQHAHQAKKALKAPGSRIVWVRCFSIDSGPTLLGSSQLRWQGVTGIFLLPACPGVRYGLTKSLYRKSINQVEIVLPLHIPSMARYVLKPIGNKGFSQ